MRELVATRELWPRSSRPARSSSSFAGRGTTSTSGSAPRCSSMPSTATRSRTPRTVRATGLIPFAGFMDLMERRYEPAIAAFLETMRARRAQRRDLQRAGAGLRTDRLPDPGRPGAALGPELPGQPLDVPGRRGRRASLADSSAAPRARVGRGPLPHPGRADAGAAGPLAQRLVRHLFPRHGFSRGRTGAQYLGRPGRARPRRSRRAPRSSPGCG